MHGKTPDNWWSSFSLRLRGTAFDPALVLSGVQPQADTAADVPLQPPGKLLCIDIKSQNLAYVIDGNVTNTYSVSTAKNGIGCRQDTACTPIGWHIVSQRIGADVAPGAIFKGRRVTGLAKDLRSDVAEDLITSRILWLSGLQPGFNLGGQVDSKNRYIYIHGTAQEHRLGKPVSEGCIRMSNSDVLELFEGVDTDTLVFIG